MSWEQLAADGRVWFRDLLSETDLTAYDEALETCDTVGGRMRSVHELTKGLCDVLERKLGDNLRPARMLGFAKTEAGNWGVPWHQDRVIAVAERYEVEGFANWSKKAGIWHCEPPLEILKRMLFVRVHLDDAGTDAGAMEIALGSHGFERVPAADAAAVASGCPVESTASQRGDVLVMDMLLLHRSRPAERPLRRRVIRVDFARDDLPPPLAWPE